MKIFLKLNLTFFIKEILFKKLEAKYIFVSNNFRFGNKREGDVKQLVKNEKIYDYKIVKPQPLILSTTNSYHQHILDILLEKGNLNNSKQSC